MGKGSNVNANDASDAADTRAVTWEEVRRHKDRGDRWIVVNGHVYDISQWQYRHPGGAKVLGHYAGEDATGPWMAFHNDKDFVRKHMKALHVGVIKEEKVTREQQRVKELTEDFERLRQKVWDVGLMKVNPWFYTVHCAQFVVLEVLAWYVAHYFGFSVHGLVITAAILAIAQAQMGWTQHDYGHQSVFNNSKYNHVAQNILMCFCKGGGAHWWNFRHHQHHAKPNVFKKDPDITVPRLFLVGDTVPKKWGLQKRGAAPYQHQHWYFWLLGPLGLLPVYFHFEISFFILKHRDWLDAVLMAGFGLRFYGMFGPVYGPVACYALYMLMRIMDSFWFVLVTQMSHLPMVLEEEKNLDWPTMQTVGTTNVTPGWFNDWFTGHLNFQIEHHLFPTMPRHNYIKAAPLVREFCKKHNLPYSVKPMGTAMVDIMRSLRKSGEIWYEAYHHM